MTADPHDVEAALRTRADALATQDWEAVEALLHDDFVYTSSRGERLTKATYLEFLRTGPLRWNRQWLEDATLVEHGGTVVLAGVVVDDVEVGGEPHVLRFATTQTYVEAGGRWLYLAGQTAPIGE